MKEERNGADITRLRVALAYIDGKGVLLQALGDGQMLGDDQARMRAFAFGLEHEGVHGLALDIESFWMVHQEPPSVA